MENTKAQDAPAIRHQSEPTPRRFNDLIQNERWGFRTCNDRTLETMLKAAQDFLHSVYKDGAQRRLAYVGGYGTGKSHLAKVIVHLGGYLPAGGWGSFKHWPSFMSKLRTPGVNVSDSIEDLAAAKGIVALDEIGVGSDNKDFGMDCLLRVLERRGSRPLVITSNATTDDLERIDPRIVSRLLRHGGVIVSADTVDFNLRERSE